MQPVRQIPEGQRTKTIYSLIRDKKYTEAIQFLNYHLQFAPKSRALSLLGYCYYQKQDFGQAAGIYEQLVRIYPEVDDYKLYHAQCLFKEGRYDESLKACQSLENPKYADRLILLQAAIKIEQEELHFAKTLLDQANDNDPDVINNKACILFKEGKYEEARDRFNDAAKYLEQTPSLAYNIALCHYKLKQLAPSLKFIADIIEKGVREHPELGIGSNETGLDAKSVGNTQALRETSLIEAFNLKAAIEYSLKNIKAAKSALLDMPPRTEEELDPVTLMNMALMNMDDDPTGGFKKLTFLLQNPPFPPETFPNILLLYAQYEYFDLAADVLAENADLTYKCIPSEDFEYIDALILQQASPEEAYRRFDELSNKHIDNLRNFMREINDARQNQDSEHIRKALKEFDEALEKYIPVVMAQAKIYWNMQNYDQVEKILKQSAEFSSDHDVWKTNVAHVLFMQEKYHAAVNYYEPIVSKNQDSLLNLTAIVIANYCVALIMVNLNPKAEDIISKLEREEEEREALIEKYRDFAPRYDTGDPEYEAFLSIKDPEKPSYHSCIVNLVIGTLYCSKGQYEFGISRIIKSMEPMNKKLGEDTWYYSKRCFLSLIETLAKHMIILKDSTYTEILQFLDSAEEFGKNIQIAVGPLQSQEERNSVSYEARQLKRLFLKLIDY